MTDRLTYQSHAEDNAANRDAYVDVILDGAVIGMIVGDEHAFIRLAGNAKPFEAFGRTFPTLAAAKAHVVSQLPFIDAVKGL